MKAAILLVLCMAVGAAAEVPKAKAPDNSTTSKLLQRMNEGRVGEWPSKAGQFSNPRYRISRLHLGSALECIKLYSTTERQGEAGQVTTRIHVEVKNGSFNSPDVAHETLSAPAEAYRELIMTFFTQELFSLPVEPERLHGISRGGNDGVTWVFECWTGQDYRVVRRWSPDAGPARICADAVMALVEQARKHQ